LPEKATWPALLVVLLACALLLVACSSGSSTPTPTLEPAEPTPTRKPTPIARGTVYPSPTPRPTLAAPLTLQLDNLTDGMKLDSTHLTVTGATTPGAQIAANGVIGEVDAQGRFAINLDLSPGENVMQVIASDGHGGEVSKVLIVIAPGGERE